MKLIRGAKWLMVAGLLGVAGPAMAEGPRRDGRHWDGQQWVETDQNSWQDQNQNGWDNGQNGWDNSQNGWQDQNAWQDQNDRQPCDGNGNVATDVRVDDGAFDGRWNDGRWNQGGRQDDGRGWGHHKRFEAKRLIRQGEDLVAEGQRLKAWGYRSGRFHMIRKGERLERQGRDLIFQGRQIFAQMRWAY